MLPASLCVPDTTDSQGTARLQELLYGEALFHSHQQDYLKSSIWFWAGLAPCISLGRMEQPILLPMLMA